MAVILVQYSELHMILGNDQEDPFDCHSLCSRLFLRATGAVRFLCMIGLPRSTTLQREREVTCEAWGDNRLYWKWDYLVPEACYRE